MFDFLRKRGPKNEGEPPRPDGVGASVDAAGASRSDTLPRGGAAASVSQDGAEALRLALATLPQRFGPFVDELETLLARVAADVEGELPASLHYAASVLEQAGAARVRPIVATSSVELGKLNQTGLFWMRFDAGEVEPKARETLLCVEAALNRLVVMADPGLVGLGAGPGLASDGACLDADWRALRAVANGARSHFADRGPNPKLELNGTRGKRGGEWDVRTRLAGVFEREVLPLRLTYSFSCRASEGKVAIRFVIPPAGALPSRVWDANTKAPVAHHMEGRACGAYALRLCALLAAAGFGASEGITSVTITAVEGSLAGQAVASLHFSRLQFRAATLERIDAGELSDPCLDLSPARVLELLGPEEARVSIAPDGTLGPVEELFCGYEPMPPMGHDMRGLPAELADLVCAYRVSDLDIFSGVESSLDEEYAKLDLAGDQTAAIEALEGMISVLDATSVGDVPMLYCDSASSRFLAGLLPDAPKRYRKAPDLAFNAREALMFIRRDRGEWGHVLELCNQMRELAPLSERACEALSVAYMGLERPKDSARVAAEGLALETSLRSICKLYYRLAYALWQMDMKPEALAAYRLCMRDGYVGQLAQDEVSDLLHEMGVSELPSEREAGERLVRVRVPYAPTSRAVDALAQRAVLLVDAGFGNAAAPLVLAIGSLRNDDVLQSVGESLIAG